MPSPAVVSLLLAGLVKALSPWIDANAIVPLYIGCLTLPAFVVANTQDGIARSHDWMRLGLMPQFIVRQSLIIGLTAGAFVLGFNLGATAAMLASAAAVWIAMIGQMIVLNRRLGGHIEPGPKAYDFRGWLAVSLPILMVESFYLLLSYTDVLVLQQFRSSEEVGVYFAVVKTLALVSFIHYAMAATTAHRFAEYHALGDKARLSAYVAHAIQWTFWPSLAATILLLALGKPLLWLFGPQFVVGYDIMFIAAVGLVVRAAIGPVERLLNMLGHQHICALAYALAFVMNVVLCLDAGAALRRPWRGGRDLDLAGVRDGAAVLDRAAAARAARAGVRETRLSSSPVMPGLDPGIQVVRFPKASATGWPGQARHDTSLDPTPRSSRRRSRVGAGDLGGIVAAQKQRQCGDLLRGHELLGRLRVKQHVLDDLLLGHVARLHGLGDLVLDQRRPDIARADAVAGDLEGRKLQRHRLGQAGDAVLGRDIGRLERRGHQRMRRGRVDDAAPAALLHAGHGGANAMKRRRQIDRDDRVPFLDRKLLDRRDELDAGIVDENVDRAEGLLAERDHFGDLGGLGHVGGRMHGA